MDHPQAKLSRSSVGRKYASDLPFRVVDHRGEQFGRLTVKELIGMIGPDGRAVWRCSCECGDIIDLPVHRLIGGTKSCGCIKREKVTEMNRAKRGARFRCPLAYSSYQAMMSRCHNKRCKDYREYGAKGITVCKRWYKNPDAFLEDMGPRPSRKYSIERRDGKKGYSPENCIWATHKTQCRNVSINRRLDFRGVSMILTDVAIAIGLRPGTLAARLDKGWPVERATTEPLHKKKSD